MYFIAVNALIFAGKVTCNNQPQLYAKLTIMQVHTDFCAIFPYMILFMPKFNKFTRIISRYLAFIYKIHFAQSLILSGVRYSRIEPHIQCLCHM